VHSRRQAVSVGCNCSPQFLTCILYTPREWEGERGREKERPSSSFGRVERQTHGITWDLRQARPLEPFQRYTTRKFIIAGPYDRRIYAVQSSKHKAIILVLRSTASRFFRNRAKNNNSIFRIDFCQARVRTIARRWSNIIARHACDIDRIDMDDNKETTKRASVRSVYLSSNDSAVYIHGEQLMRSIHP